jgi:MscS family membrane protein
MVEHILDWLAETTWLGNTCLQWAGFLAVLAGSWLLGLLLSVFMRWLANALARRARWETIEVFFHAIRKPVVLLVFGIGMSLSTLVITFGYIHRNGRVVMDVSLLWGRAVSVVIAVSLGWMIYRMADLVEHWFLRWTKRTETNMDDQLMPVFLKGIKVFLFATAALYVLHNGFNRNVSALIAGLGLTGLALALASQHAIGHLFGSVVILIDRPFQLGDTITVNGMTGTVMDVGLRSTRIRTLEGETVSIPNGMMANSSITCDPHEGFKRVFTVRIAGDAAPEIIACARRVLSDVLAAHADRFDPDYPAGAFLHEAVVGGTVFQVVYAFADQDVQAMREFNDVFNTALLAAMTKAELACTFTK